MHRLGVYVLSITCLKLLWLCITFREARKGVKEIIEHFPDVDRELIKEKFPDINVERVIERTNNRHLGNIKPKTFKWNRC